MPHPRSVVILGLALACGREVVFVDPPPASSTDTTGTDTTGTDTTVVQRVDLGITVTIAPADTALATRLGLVNGRLANAQVTARRVAGQQGPQTGTTDSLGQVTLPGLLEGVWAITALRPLSETERGLLDSANRDMTGFAGATQVDVSGAERQVAIEAAAGHQGTLVLSEAYTPLAKDLVPLYYFGGFIEVHNNSFDTLYLDGRILGESIPWIWGTLSHPECSFWARWLEDPEGIWTGTFWAFPGGGTSYPLGPGETAVIATDAIDHRVIRPDLLDLSGADFEFIGTDADVNNPAVPDMREFPPFSDFADGVLNHGFFLGGEIHIFLAEPVNPDSLVRDYLPVQRPLRVRIPKDKILDVLTSGYTPGHIWYKDDYCPYWVHPSFDGQFAELNDQSTTHSITRRLLPGSPPELRLLQRTKVSAVDFDRAPPTPGRVQ
jgi:Protein of unknown function (DUF4876)